MKPKTFLEIDLSYILKGYADIIYAIVPTADEKFVYVSFIEELIRKTSDKITGVVINANILIDKSNATLENICRYAFECNKKVILNATGVEVEILSSYLEKTKRVELLDYIMLLRQTKLNHENEYRQIKKTLVAKDKQIILSGSDIQDSLLDYKISLYSNEDIIKCMNKNPYSECYICNFIAEEIK